MRGAYPEGRTGESPGTLVARFPMRPETPAFEPQDPRTAGPPYAGAARWGAFCLCNDGVVDWALALFESLRTFEPELELRLIPFDDRVDRVRAAAGRYGYALFETPEIEALDALGRRFYPGDDFAARGFRKLAAFQGPFDYFFSFDSDVAVLGPLAPLCRRIEARRPDLVHFDTDLDQVYRPGELREAMVARGDARGFNAGLFAARRSWLSAASLAAALDDLGSDWRARLVPNAEQPFLNLYADRTGAAKVAAHELLPQFCSTCWPNVGRFACESDGYRLRDSGRWDEGRLLFAAHWAGSGLSERIPNVEVHRRFLDAARARLGEAAP